MADCTRVSIIVVNYNAGMRLRAAVESVLGEPKRGSGQQESPGLEVIVVDNASSDGSLDELRQYYQLDPRLLWQANTVNRGFAVACNQGVRQSSGECLLFLNPDCELQAGALRALLDCAAAHPDAGMVGGLLLNADGTEQVGGRRRVPTPMRTLVRAFRLQWLARWVPALLEDFNLQGQALPTGAVAVDAISGACMLVPRAALEQVGGLDEGYFLHCEDLDWCMRFSAAGWRVMFEPGAEVIHHQGTCSRDRPVFVEWHKHRGMMRFYRKFFRQRYPGPLFGLIGIAIWLRFGLWAVAHGMGRIPAALGLGK